jgi:Domain of unknown function DUF11/Calx-beta domain
MPRRCLSSAASVLLLSSGTAWAQLATLHTVDTGGVGQYTSVVYGTDGLPLISYYDVANGDLKVAHCLDVACAASTKQTIDSVGDVGRHTSLAIGQDGRAVISYVDGASQLKVARCDDTACSSASSVALTSVGSVGAGTDIAIAGGLPVIAFRGLDALGVARCGDLACAGATATFYPGGGINPTITVGGDGLPLVAHDDGGRIFLGHCNDAACTTASFITIFTPPFDGAFIVYSHHQPSLAPGADGRGVLVHLLETITPIAHSYEMRVDRCTNAACSAIAPSGSFGTLPSGDPALAVRGNDTPVLAWTRGGTGGVHLQAAQCATPACANSAPELIDGPGAGSFPSLAVSPAGLALVAYHDVTAGELKTAYLDGAPVADLSVVLADSPDPVAPSQTLSYALAAHNEGPNWAIGVAGTIALPGGVTFQAATPACQYDAAGHSVTCTGPNIAPSTQVLLGTIDVLVPAGLPGPLVATGSVGSTTPDPVLSNNSAIATTATTLGLSVAAPAVVEGNAGLTEARFDVTLLDNGNGVPSPITVFYTQGDGTATPGTDYLPVLGALTFASAGTRTVTVGVVGDLVPEPNETFFMQMSSLGLTIVANPAATIVDDDVTPTSRVELAHGASLHADLSGTPEHLFRVVVPGRASYEVVVDGLSGDLLPLSLQRLNATGTAVLQTGAAEGTGASVSLRWQNSSAVPVANQLVRVRSGGCTTDCGPDDVYRLRAYETTARIPRFNNAASQVTILLLQNPSGRTVTGTLSFWRADGQLAATSALVSLPPRSTALTNTAALVPGQGGSITVSHDGPYGVVQGKAVSLEPSTGFSFDTPLEYRPR